MISAGFDMTRVVEEDGFLSLSLVRAAMELFSMLGTGFQVELLSMYRCTLSVQRPKVSKCFNCVNRFPYYSFVWQSGSKGRGSATIINMPQQQAAASSSSRQQLEHAVIIKVLLISAHE